MSYNMSSVWQKDVLEYIPGWSGRLLPLKDISVICRKLSFILEAGISVKRAIDMLFKQSQGRVKMAVGGVLTSVMRGDSLSSALTSAKVFPRLLCGLIALGESTGCLTEVVRQSADYYERKAETENELVGALAYPVLVSLLMLAVMVMAVTFVLPSYARVFAASDIELPFITNALLSMSDSLMNNWGIVLGGFSAFLLLIVIYFKNAGLRTIHGLLLRLSLYRKFINMQLSQGLTLTLASGKNLTYALSMCVEITQNTIVKRDLQRVVIDVSAGVPLHIVFDQIKYIDILLTDMVRVGEETGMLPQTILKCQVYFRQTYTLGIKRLNKLIEPMLTIILGVLLGSLMLAVILPTFRLADVGW